MHASLSVLSFSNTVLAVDTSASDPEAVVAGRTTAHQHYTVVHQCGSVYVMLTIIVLLSHDVCL